MCLLTLRIKRKIKNSIVWYILRVWGVHKWICIVKNTSYKIGIYFSSFIENFYVIIDSFPLFSLCLHFILLFSSFITSELFYDACGIYDVSGFQIFFSSLVFSYFGSSFIYISIFIYHSYWKFKLSFENSWCNNFFHHNFDDFSSVGFILLSI